MENLIFNKDYFFHEKSLDKSFCFSKDHVSSRENNFKYVGSKLKPNANILELGTFEGKSALYFFYNFLSKEGSITTVDYKINDNLKQNLKLLADETNFVFIKANFLKLIPNLLSENKKFDLVYIDGGKDSKMTIFQIVLDISLRKNLVFQGVHHVSRLLQYPLYPLPIFYLHFL